MFLEARDLNMKARRGSASLLGIVMRSLGTDFVIRLTGKLSEVEMRTSLKIRPL